MGFQDAIRTCIAKYADFNGRARRPEYWWFVLAVFLANVASGLLDGGIFGSDTFGPIEAIVSLATLLPSLAVATRRLHDVDKSGWWLLIGLVPLAGAIVLIVWFIKPGDPGANRFGPAPGA